MTDPALAAAVAELRRPATIRQRCGAITAAVAAGASPHFTLQREQLDAVAERIARLTRSRFPDLRVPYHSRWRHFEAGGVDRKAELDAALAGRSSAALARARIDLVVVSVLLDAGAGPDWSYLETLPGRPPLRLGRSEGLAVATFRAFLAGRFSSDPHDPCRVDARALQALDAAALAALFQAGSGNPLLGLDGRARLLHRLGQAMRDQPHAFGSAARPGHLFDHLSAGQPVLEAGTLLSALLETLSTIWPSGQRLQQLPLGDAWPHPQAGGAGLSAGWVPFHKLSQWLAYSLLEPFEWAGLPLQGLDALTGLPEYRNGGLLLDAGVIQPRDPGFAHQPRPPGDPWVVEWRALTVSLLDELRPRVQQALGVAALPLACLLEGGSWAAGRQIAAERRAGGAPPVAIDSDGTVF